MKESVDIVIGYRLFAKNYLPLGVITYGDGSISTVMQRHPDSESAIQPPADIVIYREVRGEQTRDTVYNRVPAVYGFSNQHEHEAMYRSQKIVLQPDARTRYEQAGIDSKNNIRGRVITKAQLTDPKLEFTTQYDFNK